MDPKDKWNLISVAKALSSADYELGCAAHLLGLAHRPGWSAEAESMMKRCVTIREAIGAELADDALPKAGKL